MIRPVLKVFDEPLQNQMRPSNKLNEMWDEPAQRREERE